MWAAGISPAALNWTLLVELVCSGQRPHTPEGIVALVQLAIAARALHKQDQTKQA